MSLLRTIEKRLTRLVEGTFGRVFRTGVQPVELARRLVKEMDEHQQRTVRNVYVPNHFDVYLSRDDHRQLSQFSAALTTELSEYLTEHARRNEYALISRPRVRLNLDRDLRLGQFGIAVEITNPEPEQSSVHATEDSTPAPIDTLAAPPTATSPNHDQTTQVAAFTSAGPVPLVGPRIRVGRGRNNELVLDDPSVSREHAELITTTERSGWRVRDLDSTNGIRVNGDRVQAQSLELGDVVTFGSYDVRIDRWESLDKDYP